MSELKRRFRLHDLMDVWSAQTDAPNPKTRALTSIAETHRRNVRRLYLLAMFLPAIVNAVDSMGQIRSTVRWRRRSDVEIGIATREEMYREIEQEIQADMEKRALLLSAGGQVARERLNTEAIHGFNILNEMLGTELAEGGDAWLSAQVTATWTAFEALAEELWEAALNEHPQVLAELGGPKGRGDQDKSLPLWMLQKHDYNLSQKMGTVLKSKYGFDSLDGIRDGYREAFTKDGEHINRLLSDKSLEALSLVRNLIVHNGSVMDEPYLRRASALPPAAVGNLGDVLCLDGALVYGLVTRPLQLSSELMAAVDTWLVEHPL